MKYYYLIFISILFSCNNKIFNDKSIFIGGNIINPSSKFVLLYKNEEMIDTIFLDQENKFSKRFFNLSPGVYKLEHPPKNESVFLENGDSIWTRVNTVDFNASISFSGIGSGKNNYLVKNKNQLRNETSFLSSKYSLDPLIFSKIIDSLLNVNNQNWKKFDSLSELSELGKKITQSSYIYPYANRKERYYLIRGGSNIIKDKSKFFNFRKKLNYEEEELNSFEPYIKYLLSYVNNIVINSDKNYFKTMGETSFNINRLIVIDSTIYSKKLRSTLFRSIAYDELINFENHKNHKKFIDFFSKLQNGSENHIEEIKSLYNSISLMQKGKKLPSIELEDTNFNKINSNTIFENKPSSTGGAISYKSICKAAKLYKNKSIRAIVTAPISKESLHMAGHKFDGHTGLLGSLFNIHEPYLMLANKRFSTLHITCHKPLKEAIKLITKERVMDVINIGYKHMLKFNKTNPRIAVCGLNPHAGENGIFGLEEINEIIPAVKILSKKGFNIIGPISSDIIFREAVKNKYDLVIANYHDQGHIPVKLLYFDQSVNVTLGVPFIRTSVDHGTAFDIAYKNKASAVNMLNAIFYALKMSNF